MLLIFPACGGGGGGSPGNSGNGGNSTPALQMASGRAPLPPWMTYCDTGACDAVAPLSVYACPAGNAQCTPARSTTIIAQVDNLPVSGMYLALSAPQGESVRLVSGEGIASVTSVSAYRAPSIMFGSDQDVLLSYYNVAPVWGGITPLPFVSKRFTSALVDSVFYRHPSYDTGTAAADLHARAQSIVTTQRAIAGVSSEHVTAFFMPTEFVNTPTGEGNFSYGNGTVTINYGNPPYISAMGGILRTALPRFAHEFTHELTNEIRPAFAGNFSCLNEGVADALPYAAGFLPEEDFGPVGLRGTNFDSSCTALSEMHDVGNCYFWHARKAGLLTQAFLRAIFHPGHAYDFDSCAQNTLKTGNSILVLFTEAAGGASMLSVLDSMQIPHASSYEAAKQALGF